MIKKIKKGDIVVITIEVNDDILEVNGVVGDISKNNIKVFHNFSGKDVIDFTTIKIDEIKKIEIGVSIEINKLSEIYSIF